jgi:membrane protease YdiL (CAAX protease family)
MQQEAGMTDGMKRTALALMVFVGWVLITVVSGDFLGSGTRQPQPLNVPISTSIQLNLAAAVVFLLVVVVVFRWMDIGLNTAPPARSLRVLWFPAAYLALFLMLALFAGFPPLSVLAIIFANTALAGISEELATRGVLYTGLRATLAIWPSALLSTLLFGLVHVLNGFATGDFVASGVQAVTAFMTGIAFMGIRLYTRSLYPGIVIHALWDFLLIAAVTGMATRFGVDMSTSAAAGAGEFPWQAFLLPVALIVPNFFYGLFLLRAATRRDAATV